ncbi:Ribonuclease h-like superfamily protein [Thalictrum thalictroides]|uniref:Ribonuclease h-like superfamily protein n=1 Tax=Thalictrum thalictroides TaxID=46969 RepID=A0A7J6X108_THATH|nr:Ribonuclease h-like superfamily protein [Thalictrum thalictroides]
MNGPLIQYEAAREAWLMKFSSEALVAVLITDGNWNHEVHQLQNRELRESILSKRINSRMEVDRIIWTPSKDGKYSAKTAYTVLSEAKPRVKWHGLVWSKLVIPKHAFNTWQLLSGCLPTQDRLVNRKILNVSSCIFCNNCRENSKHLFFECSYTREVWNHVRVLLDLQVDNRNTNRLWMSIFRLCGRQTSEAKIYSVMVCATVNYIWGERNARRFQGKSQTAVNLKIRLVKELRRYLQLQIRDIPDTSVIKALVGRLGIITNFRTNTFIPCTWTRPLQGTIKINCDGAVKADGSGFGGLLRDSEGQVVCAYSGRGFSSSVYQQELNAVHKGIQLAKDQGFTKIEVASDSLGVIRTMNKMEEPPWDCQDQVREIRELAAWFEEIRFYHAFRETNRAADYLAGIGVEAESFICFIAPFPVELCIILEEDKNNKVYLRFHQCR